MARNTPPTIISYTETAAWNTAATTKATASVSWNSGDQILVIAGNEGSSNINLPTATGLTFTSILVNNGATSSCSSRAAIATAGSTSSSAVTVTQTASVQYGFGVWVLRGSDGLGSSGEQHTATKTKSVVPTDTHSAWLIGSFDFGAGSVSGVAVTPAASHTRQIAASAGHYTFVVGDIADQASGASTAYGTSGGASGGPFSLAIVEVLGTTTGGATLNQLAALGVG